MYGDTNRENVVGSLTYSFPFEGINKLDKNLLAFARASVLFLNITRSVRAWGLILVFFVFLFRVSASFRLARGGVPRRPPTDRPID